jgi:hypothetical protein
MARAGLPWDEVTMEDLEEALEANKAVARFKFPLTIKFYDRQGKNYYVSVAYPKNENLKGKKEIVAPPSLIMEYIYPLSGEFSFLHLSENAEGFTRGELLESMSETYKQIYREEDEYHREQKESEESRLEERQYQRALREEDEDESEYESDEESPYGIWGHDIGDLVVEEINRTDETEYGLPVYRLSIGS